MTTAHLEKPDWSSLPIPEDDGAMRHLVLGTRLASVDLAATDGTMVDLSRQDGWVVVYAYPRTGRPETPIPDGWDLIPGARGCTPQSCAFRDHFAELRALGVDRLFGLSTQDTPYQREAVARLHLPFAILSDAEFKLTEAMRLPTFTTASMKLLRRFNWVIEHGRIAHTFYPVFPPDENAGNVAGWFRARSAGHDCLPLNN